MTTGRYMPTIKCMNLTDITSCLVRDLEAWLNSPSEASQDVQSLKERLEDLKGALGAKAVSSALKSLRHADRNLLRSRQREAAVSLVEACKRLGIPLVAGTPPKRRRKSAKPAPAPTKLGSPASAPATNPDGRRVGDEANSARFQRGRGE